MTKEEVIEFLIEERKKGNKNGYTDFCKMYSCCNDYPCYEEYKGCIDGVVNVLIERLLKAEESKSKLWKVLEQL